MVKKELVVAMSFFVMGVIAILSSCVVSATTVASGWPNDMVILNLVLSSIGLAIGVGVTAMGTAFLIAILTPDSNKVGD